MLYPVTSGKLLTTESKDETNSYLKTKIVVKFATQSLRKIVPHFIVRKVYESPIPKF